MKTSFVAFLNKHGIACASDTDMTLYALSRQEPVALAVNSYSPIPWDAIINAYLQKGDIPLHEKFSDYAQDFANYLSTLKCQSSWKELTEDEQNIIFLGFGTDDVFPWAVDTMVHYDAKEHHLTCDFPIARGIDHQNATDFYTLSHFDNTQTIIYGITDAARKKLIDEHTQLFEIYKQRIKEKVKDTRFEEVVLRTLEEYDPEMEFAAKTFGWSDKQLGRIHTALDFFNMEDLVKVAENFVDAKVQLDHLKDGGKGELHYTKELAVITRTEGLVWIKHCLYGNLFSN